MDTRTMFLVVGIGYATFGVMLILVHVRPHRLDRTLWLGVGFLLAGVGVTMQGMRFQLPELMSVWLGNTLAAFGLLLQVWGVQTLAHRRPTLRARCTGAGALTAAILLAIVLPRPTQQIWASIVYAVLFVLPAWTLVRWRSSASRTVRLAVATALLAVFIGFLTRALRIFLDPTNAGIFTVGDGFAAAYLVLYISMMTTGFGLLLLSKAESDQAILDMYDDLSSILESLPTAMCVVRAEMVVHANPAAERLFAYPSGTLVAVPLTQLLPDDAGVSDDLTVEREIEAVSLDGRRLWIWLSARPLTNAPAGRTTILSMTEITAIKQAQAALETKASTDSLTGLLNRRAFRSAGDRAVSSARTTGGALCLGILDVDRLKEINDEFGHAAGDQALMHVAHACHQAVGDIGVVGRLGGDEFALVLPDYSSPQGERVIHRLQRELRASPLRVRGTLVEITVSAGLAELDPGDTFDALMERADASMYEIKRSRRTVAAVARQSGDGSGARERR